MFGETSRSSDALIALWGESSRETDSVDPGETIKDTGPQKILLPLPRGSAETRFAPRQCVVRRELTFPRSRPTGGPTVSGGASLGPLQGKWRTSVSALGATGGALAQSRSAPGKDRALTAWRS